MFPAARLRQHTGTRTSHEDAWREDGPAAARTFYIRTKGPFTSRRQRPNLLADADACLTKQNSSRQPLDDIAATPADGKLPFNEEVKEALPCGG